jgi:prolyl oligopeptidase
MDVATGQEVDGPIDRCRYTGVAWLPGGKAFYYVRRLAPDQVPDGEEQYHRRVYLHQVGASADEDTEIFGAGRDKTDYFGVAVSRDGRWLTVSAAAGTAPRNDLWLADLPRPARPRRTWRSCRRAWTRRPACTRAGTGGCTCSPTGTRRAAG